MEITFLDRLINDQREEFLAKSPGTSREVGWKDLVSLGRILVVTGIRRSGKSTLLRQIADSLQGGFIYLNFDDIRLSGFVENDYNLLLTLFAQWGKDCVYLFDEVQMAPAWERFLRRMHDMGSQIVVTGSNSSILSEELGSHLTGRYMKQELFPFSFREFLRFHNGNTIQSATTSEAGMLLQQSRHYLDSGGFPEYQQYHRRELLEHIFKDILFRDIIARHGIQEKVGIQDLAVYLMSNPGSKISYSKLARVMGIKSPTSVKEYLGYMEDVYLLFQVRKFDWSLKRSMLAPRKIYPVDNGLSSSVAFRTSPNLGHKLEIAVFIQMRKKGPVWYFTDKGECDFITKAEEGYICTQVCWYLDGENREREFSGLDEAMQFFNQNTGTIVTLNQEETLSLSSGRTVQIIPFWKWADKFRS